MYYSYPISVSKFLDHLILRDIVRYSKPLDVRCMLRLDYACTVQTSVSGFDVTFMAVKRPEYY